MKTIPWLRTLNDLAIDHDWPTADHMRVATGLSYMKCRQLLGGEEPKWSELEALARATSMAPGEIACLHDVNASDYRQETLDGHADVRNNEETCQLRLPLPHPTSSETPAPSEGCPTGASGTTDAHEPLS